MKSVRFSNLLLWVSRLSSETWLTLCARVYLSRLLHNHRWFRFGRTLWPEPINWLSCGRVAKAQCEPCLWHHHPLCQVCGDIKAGVRLHWQSPVCENQTVRVPPWWALPHAALAPWLCRQPIAATRSSPQTAGRPVIGQTWDQVQKKN